MARQKREQTVEQKDLPAQQEETLRRIEVEQRQEQAQQQKAQQERPTEEEDQEAQDEPEKLSRTQCAHRVIATEIDGDTPLYDLAVKADALYRASRPNAEADEDTAAWHVQKELETLEGIGLVSLHWECIVHPTVVRFGLPGKNGKA
jgi:hypothetical protein